jgi:zinc protease
MKRSLILMLSLTIITLSVSAQTVNLKEKLPIDETIIFGKLDNGLTYYIKENSTPENRAELMLAVHAGSVLEDDDQQGLAHFCEHMAFNGTKNFPKHELINYLESTGMKFGADVNAYTSFDETVYGITIPLDSAEMLDKGLLVLFDWAHQVSFEDEEIDAERGVIHEEWRMGQGAMDRMQRKMFKALFHNSKYAERLPIGLMSVVDSCEYDALKRFYAEWYRPDLQALVIVGDFDGKEMEARVKDLFSQMPAKENPREREIIDIPSHKETIVSVASDPEAPMGMLMMFYKHGSNPVVTVEDYRRTIVEGLLNSMINKRLQELTLKENPPFVQASSAYTDFIGPKAVFMSFALLQNNDLNAALEAVVAENRRMDIHGFTQTELEREKASLLKSVEKQYNEREKRKSESFAREFVSNFLPPHSPIPGIEYEYNLYSSLMDGISLEEVNALAKNLVTEENVVISVMMPEKEGIEIPSENEVLEAYNKFNSVNVDAYVDEVKNEPLIAELPPKGKVKNKEKNKELGYETWTLDNGVKVVIMPTEHKKDEIRFEAFSWGGNSVYELEDDINADIAIDVAIESGLGNFDKQELTKHLAGKNANVTPYLGEFSEGLRGSCSVSDFETMLQLIHLSFTKPRITQTAFNSYINKQKGLLENAKSDPQQAWRDTLTVTMADYHPRRRVLTPELLDEADYRSVKKIVEHRFGDPGNFTFYFVGNIDKKKAKKLVEQYLGSLPEVGRNENYRDLGIRPPKGIVDKTVNKGVDAKCMVMMNLSGEMEYTYQERLVQNAINMILSTKLLEEIREKASGVYTIGAYPNHQKHPEPRYSTTIFFTCDPERSEELTAGVFAEIDKLMENGPEEKDIAKMQEKMKREHETGVKENSYWLSKLKEIDQGSITLEDMDSFETIVNSFDRETLQKAAKQYLNHSEYIRVMLKAEE